MNESENLPASGPFVPLQASGDETQAAPAWYHSSWAYRKKITVDHTRVGENLVRYPMYVRLDGDPDLAARAQADRDDVLFTAADGVTKLDHELVAPKTTASSNITQMDSNGAWSWFGDPRGLYHEGQRKQTYLGWVDNAGSIFVSVYNHVSRTSQKVKLHDRLQRDDHANPSLLMRADGRLMVFYSPHSGTKMYYRIADNVEDISSWGPEKTIPPNPPGSSNYTYPNPVQLSAENGRIFLFWRGGNNPTYSTSGDGGGTWATAKTLFSVPGQRPYVKVVSNDRDEIHFTLTDGHPRNAPNNNVYHFYYKSGGFYRSNGTFIKSVSQLPLLLSEFTRVYDAASGGSKAWTWDIALDATGKPAITYANFPTDTDHRYRYARWDGTAWRNHEVTRGGSFIANPTEPNYSGGIVLDGKNPNIVYLSRQVGSAWEVERWTTTTGGASWTSQAITANSGSTKNVRPFVPRNHADALSVVWMSGSYPFYTTYDTGLKGYPALDPGVASSEAYVEIPNMSNTVNTELYMYYGNPSAANQSNPTATWGTSYRAVHHMNNTTSTVLSDSTTNNVDGTKSKSTNPVEANGRINKAQRFDGNNNPVNLGALSMAGWGAVSAEAWFTYEKEFKAARHTLISSWRDGGDILVRVDTTTDRVEAYVRASGKVQVGGAFADLAVVDSQPHYIAVTYDTVNGLRAYLDGRRSTTTYPQKGPLDSGATGPLQFGASPHITADSFRGKLDEVRLSNFVRSDAWIAAQNLNMSSPSSFYSLGPQEPRPL